MAQETSPQAAQRVCQVDPEIQDRYRFLKAPALGEGSFGKVCKALVQRGPRGGQTVAVKTVTVQSMEEKLLAQTEISVLQDCYHKNIVSYLDSVVTEHNLYIVTELMESSLGDLLVSVGEKHFGDEHISQQYTFQMLRGLEYLHSKQPQVIHRDLKCDNLLVDKHGTVKLADFGIALVMSRLAKSEMCGTPYYIAPEVVKTGNATIQSDTWGVGCCVYEMATMKPPLRAMELDDWIERMQALAPDEPPQLPEDATPHLRAFLGKCFQVSPSARPSARDLLHEHWVSDYTSLPGTFRREAPGGCAPVATGRNAVDLTKVCNALAQQEVPQNQSQVVVKFKHLARVPCDVICTVRNFDPLYPEVMAFQDVQQARAGTVICAIPKDAEVTLVGRWRDEPNEYATIVIDLDRVDFTRTGNELARQAVSQNLCQVVVKFKHLVQIPHDIVCTVRNADPLHAQVRAFENKDRALEGVNICGIPKDMRVTLVGHWRDEPEEYATIVIDPDKADFTETGEEKARQHVSLNLCKGKGKSKPLAQTPGDVVCTVRNFDPLYPEVMAFQDVQQARAGRFICAIPKDTEVTLVGRWRDEPNEYATIVINLDQVDFTNTGNGRARQAVSQNRNQVVVKFKHLVQMSHRVPEPVR